MRDTFLLLWTAFLIIGVVGSIVSSIRKQIQGARPPVQRPIPPQWQPPPPQQPVRRVVLSGTVPAGQAPRWLQQATAEIAAQAQRTAPQPVAAKAPAAQPPKPVRVTPSGVEGRPTPHADLLPPHSASKGGVARLFRHRGAIVQAVIAAEVLGKPRAFNDEYFGA